MGQYVYAIQVAAILFPILALVLTLPYLVYHYKKFGAAPFLRGVMVYSFFLYLLCVYFLVILPLPDPAEVAHYTTATTQLIPFDFIQRGDWASTAFNLAMFLPLGVYLRYFFRRGWTSVLLICLLGSLFCELTQLSALYGLYPRPYRLFDVDDLITNTLGGMLGFWLTPLFALVLPERDALDRYAYEKGRMVPHLRRFLAFLIDTALILIAAYFMERFLYLPDWVAYAVGVLIFMVAIPTLAGGRTAGKGFFRMRLVRRTDEVASWWRYLVCYALFYGALWYLFYLLPLFLLPFCDRISGLKNISTIQAPEAVD